MSNNSNQSDHEIAQNLSELIMLFAIKFIKRFERQAIHNLSPLQFHTLFFLEFEGPQTMSQLCGFIQVSKQQMTPIVDKLVELELVTRSHDLRDRRNVSISINENGLHYIKTRKANAAAQIQLLLSTLSEEDLQSLGNSSNELANVLKKLPDVDSE